MKHFVVALAIWLMSCGSGGSMPQESLHRIGIGPADVWHTLSLDYVDAAAKQRLGFVVTEDRPSVQEADWRRGEIPERFSTLARQWNKRICAAGQIHIVFGINWNMLPLREQSDAWFAEQMTQWLEDYDPSCTWLEALVEPDEGDLGKRQRWLRFARDSWPGVFLIPAAGQHWGIDGDYIDFHPSSMSQAEQWLQQPPRGLQTLLVTDGGPFVHPPTVFQAIPSLVQQSVDAQVPLVFYTDRYAPGNWELHREVLEVVGRAARLAAE
jgi:hypothetical protein